MFKEVQKVTLELKKSIVDRLDHNKREDIIIKVEVEKRTERRNTAFSPPCTTKAQDMRRYSECALDQLAEDYHSQLSNQEPYFMRRRASLADSRDELKCYEQISEDIERNYQAGLGHKEKKKKKKKKISGPKKMKETEPKY